MSMFYEALDIALELEGGYVNDPKDLGGETKYGISKRSYPELDIARLTLTDARTIYKQHYWSPLKCDQFKWPMCLYLFDMGVNSGNNQAVKTLQRALGVTADGFIGDVTINAANNSDTDLYLTHRILFYQSLNTYSTYGKGWVKRLFKLQRLANAAL